MEKINSLLSQLAHNYLLIVIAAILFFAIKSVIGIITYKHYNKEFQHLHKKLDSLLKKISEN